MEMNVTFTQSTSYVNTPNGIGTSICLAPYYQNFSHVNQGDCNVVLATKRFNLKKNPPLNPFVYT